MEGGPVPGGLTPSEALDAIGKRRNYLCHAHESHHIKWGGKQGQGF